MFWEFEAAIEFGYRIGDWMREHPIYRAMAIAHLTEKRLREGYENEKMMDKAKDGGRKTLPSPVDMMKARWGLPT